MKKLVALLLFISLCSPAWAAVGSVFSVGDLKYVVANEPASSSSYGRVTCSGLSDAGKAKSSLSLTIPYNVSYGGSNYLCTTVGANAFYNCSNIANVRLTYGIKDVAASAFQGCTNLTYVRLPSSINYLREKCFYGCNNLSNVYYAGMADDIITNGNAFSPRSSRTLWVPWGADYTTMRGRSAFSAANFPTIKNSSSAWDYSMVDGTQFVVTKHSLTSSEPHEATIIGFNSSAAGVINGKCYPSFSTMPVGQNSSFKYVAVSDSAFLGNTGLKTLDLSRATGIKTLGRRSVAMCTALTSINLGSIETIGAYAFIGCSAITFLFIPASTTFIQTGSFVDECTALTEINVASGNPNYSAYNRSLYNKSKTTLYRVPEGHDEQTMTFHPALKTIANYAMYDCKNILRAYFDYGLESVGTQAFRGCSDLNMVALPASLKTLGSGAFMECGRLIFLAVNALYPPTIDASTMFYDASRIKLYVRDGRDERYQSAGWTGFSSYNDNNGVSFDARYGNTTFCLTSIDPVTINGTQYDGTCMVVGSDRFCYPVSGETYIPKFISINGKDYAVTEFSSNAVITTHPFYITGCECVKKVNGEAFAGKPITQITLPQATDISYRAFKECASLTSVSIPNVKKIGSNAFENCTSLPSISLPNVTKIESGAFRGCSSLSLVTFPNVEEILSEAFSNCPALTTARWGYDLDNIGERAFAGASLTHDIILPVGVSSIGKEAFSGAKSKRILFPSSAGDVSVEGMALLEELIVNGNFFSEGYSHYYYFTGVPSTCKLLVSAGCKAKAQANVHWSYFKNIEEGAYDFALNGSHSSQYKMKVTTRYDSPHVTDDGVEYWGKAVYVYNPKIKTATGFVFDNLETYKLDGMEGRKFMMVGVGDSCFAHSNVTSLDFSRMKHIERIGRKAFYGSKLTNADFSKNQETINMHNDAFYNATNLKEIVIGCKFTHDSRFFGNNASDFTCFVPLEDMYSVRLATQNYVYDSDEQCDNRLAPCFTATASTHNVGVMAPLNYEGSGLTAYSVFQAGNPATGIIHATKAYNIPSYVGYGVILANLTPGQFYKIKRYPGTSVLPVSGYLKVSNTQTDLKNVANSYYWDATTKKFIKPSGSYTVNSGRSYLVMPGGAPEYRLDIFANTGDVNGDGSIDITDANVLINVMLGKVSASTYPGADVNGNGSIDVGDLNAVLNIILGK